MARCMVCRDGSIWETCIEQLNPSVSTSAEPPARKAGTMECSATSIDISKCSLSNPKFPATPQQEDDSTTCATPQAASVCLCTLEPKAACSWQWVWTIALEGGGTDGSHPCCIASPTATAKVWT